MTDQYIATYLNDHMAGSVVAIELLEYLESAHETMRPIVADIRADIEADRRELESLMLRQRVTVSRSRKAVAWLAEKMTELKLRVDDSSGGPLRRLEALETVALGIEGKRALWRTLAALAPVRPGLRGVDYESLERRAVEQRRRVETLRMDAARAALGNGRELPKRELT